jgi:anti-sigma factor RsiW
VTPEIQLLFRYLDGELSPEEAGRFRELLAANPELSRQLAEQQQLGRLVRGWAAEAEERAQDLVGPTLERVKDSERRRAQRTSLGYALAAVLVLALPWSRRAPELVTLPAPTLAPVGSAAIERVEAPDRRAQVFVVGSASTPVVWLADDAQDDDDGQSQDPG